MPTKNTQSLNFWEQRIKEGGSVEMGMAVGFEWHIIDPIHKEYIKKYIKPQDKVLDAGCGYGRIANWFEDKNYTGTDFVEEFIREARKRNPTKEFLLSDLSKLPFRDKEFDWGLLISVKVVIRSDPNGEKKWKKVEKELKRVCKRLLILEYGDSDPKSIHEAVEII